MSIIIFIIVLVALIVVHEFGHFIAAKLAGMRVDEFGIGYPPRALTLFKKGETEYTLNWLPFGGFVKIRGEDGLLDAWDPRAFSAKPQFAQAIVLVAGVAMNLLFAYVLITGALIIGTPQALEEGDLARAKNIELAVAKVLPDSPASVAGLEPGDSILKAASAEGTWQATDPESFTTFISKSKGEPITLTVTHNNKEETLTATPKAGIVASDPSRYALGVQIATIGVIPVAFTKALTEGAHLTWGALILTAEGLWHFFSGVVTFSANLSQVSGPIGIAGAVGSASSEGLGYLFSIMAVISINLAIINLLPVPALDGGRLLFVIIESIIRRPIKPRVAQTINAIGFSLLILLMVVVSAHDIFKLAS
jgi:regulator of sigma E protease